MHADIVWSVIGSSRALQERFARLTPRSVCAASVSNTVRVRPQQRPCGCYFCKHTSQWIHSHSAEPSRLATRFPHQLLLLLYDQTCHDRRLSGFVTTNFSRIAWHHIPIIHYKEVTNSKLCTWTIRASDYSQFWPRPYEPHSTAAECIELHWIRRPGLGG
jgi:hypothetical protein